MSEHFDLDDILKMKELDVVVVPHTIIIDGQRIEAGRQGTIVYEWPNSLVEVEFSEPSHVATMSKYSLRLVHSYEPDEV